MTNVIKNAVRHGHTISVCSECAMEAGGEWPEGHCATFWQGECRACGKVAAVCCTSDWNWPGKKGRKLTEARREV